MKRLMVCVLVAVLVLLSPIVQAHVQHSAPTTLYGVGLSSCGKWTADRGVVWNHLTEWAWVLGFISGATAAIEATTQATTPTLVEILDGIFAKVYGTGGRPASATTDQTDRHVFRTTDGDGIEQWMDQYCAQHPLESIADAAVKLLVTLKVP